MTVSERTPVFPFREDYRDMTVSERTPVFPFREDYSDLFGMGGDTSNLKVLKASTANTEMALPLPAIYTVSEIKELLGGK